MASTSGFISQAAALPLRNGRICLITSSNGKRWVIPKGLIEPGQTAAQTALCEAWEEAGLTGTLSEEPVGSYVYEKWCGACHVLVYVMQISEVAQEYPERDLRQRVWLSPVGALERLEDPGLVEIVRQVLGKPVRPFAASRG